MNNQEWWLSNAPRISTFKNTVISGPHQADQARGREITSKRDKMGLTRGLSEMLRKSFLCMKEWKVTGRRDTHIVHRSDEGRNS